MIKGNESDVADIDFEISFIIILADQLPPLFLNFYVIHINTKTKITDI